MIAAPARPALVVAGAGAGKTETMAARVVWLVAIGAVLPEQVLGLTFTRKAAQQLGVAGPRRGCAGSPGSRLLDELDPSGERRAALLAGEPTVATYHAYAGRLVGEHAPAPARRARRPAAGRDRRRGSSRTGWSRTWADDLDVDVCPPRSPASPRAGRRARRAPRRAGGGAGARRGAGRGCSTAAPPGQAAAGRAVPDATSGGSRRSGSGVALLPLVRGVRRAEAGRAGARLRRPARHRRPRRRRRTPRSARRSGPPTARCCSTSTRTPGTPSGSCCARCSAPRPGDPARPGRPRRSPPSATPASRSTAGAGPARATCARFRTDFPGPDGARRPVRPAHQLPQPARGAGAGERRVRAAARCPGGGRGRRAGGRARAPAPGDVRVALLPDVAAELDWMADAIAAQWRGRRGRGGGAAHVGRAGAPPRRHGRRSPPRCAPATCRSRWSASAACSTPRRCATW